MDIAPDEALESGDKLGPYVVWKSIGAGGMGEVYEAYEENLNRRVALKTISPKLAADPTVIERFKLEGQALARLNHPNVISIYSLGHDKGLYFLAMEYVEGKSLLDFTRSDVYGMGELLSIFEQLFRGVLAAHENCVIHRDLKPNNILLTQDLRVKIVDFGIAKLYDDLASDITKQGQFLGTIRYIAPEIVRGGAPTAQSDIWSLGVILFEILTDANPFLGQNDLETLENIKAKKIEIPAKTKNVLPKRMQDLVLKMLERDPQKRFQNLGLALAELEKIAKSDFPSELLTHCPRSTKISNFTEATSAVKLLDMPPIEEKMLLAMAFKIEHESTGGVSLKVNAKGNSEATIGTAKIETSPEISISNSSIKKAVDRLRSVKTGEAAPPQTGEMEILQGQEVNREQFETALEREVTRTKIPELMSRPKRVMPAPPTPAPNLPNVKQRAKTLEVDSATPTSVKRPNNDLKPKVAQRIRRDQEMLRATRGQKSSLPMLLLFLLVSIGGGVAFEQTGALDRWLFPKFAAQNIESRVQKEFRIAKRSLAIDPLTDPNRQLNLGYQAGDEFTYAHEAVNHLGQKFESGQSNYLLVAILGERAAWSMGGGGTEKSDLFPFHGEWEAANQSILGRTPAQVSSESADWSPEWKKLFPLAVGNKATMSRHSSPQEKYSCEVKARDNSRVPAGEFEVYKVFCSLSGGQITRSEEFHYAPILSHWIYRRTEMRQGERSRSDTYTLLSRKRASAP